MDYARPTFPVGNLNLRRSQLPGPSPCSAWRWRNAPGLSLLGISEALRADASILSLRELALWRCGPATRCGRSHGRRFRDKDEDLEQLRKEFSLRKAELATALLASADVRSLIEMIFDTSYAETQYFLKAPTKPLLKANKQVVWKILSQLPEGIPLVSVLRDLAQRHGLEAAPDIFLELQLILSELIATKTVNADLADTLEYGWQIGSPLFGKPSSFASQNRYQRSASAPVKDYLSRRDAVAPRVDENTLLSSQDSKSKQHINNVTDTRMRLETPYAPSTQISDFPTDRAGSSRFASRRMSYTGSEPASSLYTTDSDDDSLSTSSRMSLLVAVSEANETDSTFGSVDDIDIGSDVQQQAENEDGFTSGRFQMRQSECTSTSDDSGFDQQEAHILSVPANSAPGKADTPMGDSSVKLASSEPGTCDDMPTTSTMEPESCTSNGAKDEAESSEANLPAESADSYDSDQQAEDKLPISSSVVLSGKYPESEFYTPEMWTYSGDRDGTSFEEGNELLEDAEKVKPEEDMPEDVKVMVVATSMDDTYVSVSVQPILDSDEAGAQADVAKGCRGPSSFKTDRVSVGEAFPDGGRNLEVDGDCTDSVGLHSEGGTSKQEQRDELTDRKQESSAVMHKEQDPTVAVRQGKQQPSNLVEQLEVTQEEGPTDEVKQEPEQKPSGREQDTGGEFVQDEQKPSDEDSHRERAPGKEPSNEATQIQEKDKSNSTVRPEPDTASTEEVAGGREDAIVEQNVLKPSRAQEPSEGQGSQEAEGEQGQPEAVNKTDDKDQEEASASETDEHAGRVLTQGTLGENEAAAPVHDRQEEGKPEVAAEQEEPEPAGKRTSNEDKEPLFSGSDEEPGGESPKFDIPLDTKDEAAGVPSHGRRSIDQSVPHSGLIPLSGPIQYSGSIPYSGNLSLRSDSSTNSTRSFAFPILHADWSSSPVKMAPADRRFLRRRQHIWKRWCCCFNCASHH